MVSVAATAVDNWPANGWLGLDKVCVEVHLLAPEKSVSQSPQLVANISSQMIDREADRSKVVGRQKKGGTQLWEKTLSTSSW